MNILHAIVIAVLTIAGYALHGPLLGPGGILNKKDPVVETPSSNKSKIRLDGDKEPAGNSSTDKGSKATPPVANVPNFGYHINKVVKADFPKECAVSISGAQAIVSGGVLPLKQGAVLFPVEFVDEKRTKLKVKIKSFNVFGQIALDATNFEKLVENVTVARLVGGQFTPDGKTAKVEPKNNGGTVTPPPVNPPVKEKPKVTLLDDSKIMNLMKIGYKEVRTLRNQKLTAATVGSTELIDGKEYQTGVITFKKDTLLGVLELKAKAVIFDGKIENWVWANSNQRIR